MCAHWQVHLANIKIENVCDIDETSLSAGDHVTTFDLDGIKCGVAICYDINFDDYIKLYRKEGEQCVYPILSDYSIIIHRIHYVAAMKTGCQILFFPAAFHEATGPTHWELLTRARACDNQFYLAAISPARDPAASYVTWGHSLIADPSGRIIVKAGQSEEIVTAEIGKWNRIASKSI